MLGRWLAALIIGLALSACGRTPLRSLHDGPVAGSARAGAAGSASGAGGRSGDGAGGGGAGRGGVGAGGRGGDSSAGDGSAGASFGGSGGVGAGGQAGAAGVAGGQAGASGFAGSAGQAGASGFAGSAGQAGASGFSGEGGVAGGPIGGGQGGFSGMAGEILNPHRCDTPHPFVLSIDPIGTSGSVRGWLESTAGLVFEDQLPRFVRNYSPFTVVSSQAIALWWSIAGVDGGGRGRLYFYPGDFTGSMTQTAVAHGATRFADVDVDALDFRFETVDARTGSILVFRNAETGETVALRLDQIIITDPEVGSFCAAVDASWLFLR